MKNVITLFAALWGLFGLFGCGTSSEDAAPHDQRNGESDTIAQSALNDDSVRDGSQIDRDSIRVADFVERMYSSLELSPELNERQDREGGVIFNLSGFKSCLNRESIYSKDRIENLSGDYHERYNIDLVRIESIAQKGDFVEVIANVEYEIYEFGGFINTERLLVNLTAEGCTLQRWEDVKLKELRDAGYGDEALTESDFYRVLGSVNK